jgi:hypothetical protein
MTSVKKELEELRARIEELEGKPAKPRATFEPIHHIDRVGLPASVMREFAAAAPDSLVRDIVNDHRGAPEGPTSIVRRARAEQDVERGTGWTKPAPLKPPPGVSILDRVMDAQDALDRADRERRLKGEG